LWSRRPEPHPTQRNWGEWWRGETGNKHTNTHAFHSMETILLQTLHNSSIDANRFKLLNKVVLSPVVLFGDTTTV